MYIHIIYTYIVSYNQNMYSIKTMAVPHTKINTRIRHVLYCEDPLRFARSFSDPFVLVLNHSAPLTQTHKRYAPSGGALTFLFTTSSSLLCVCFFFFFLYVIYCYIYVIVG